MNMKEKPDYIRQSDWDDVDIPELTGEDFARMRPATELLPEVVVVFRQNGGFIPIAERCCPQKITRKMPTTVSLDRKLVPTETH